MLHTEPDRSDLSLVFSKPYPKPALIEDSQVVIPHSYYAIQSMTCKLHHLLHQKTFSAVGPSDHVFDHKLLFDIPILETFSKFTANNSFRQARQPPVTEGIQYL